MPDPVPAAPPPSAVQSAILRNLRRAHVGLGLATVAVFLLTGVAMLLMFPAVYHANESVRYLYRASHVYILFAGLLNVALGTYVSPSHAPGRRIVQLCGSVLLFVAPALFVWAFVSETWKASPSRPITVAGVVACLAAVGLHFLSRPGEGRA